MFSYGTQVGLAADDCRENEGCDWTDQRDTPLLIFLSGKDFDQSID